MNIEYIHVSQLYETVLTFAILTLLVTEILAGYNKLWGHITQIRTKDRDQELKWIKIATGGQDEKSQEAQKSAIESLRREMSMYQSKGQNENEQKQSEDNQKESIDKLLGELSPIQKSILLFYMEYGNFMSHHVPLILSILVLGILTNSTMVFSLACFFCYLFTALMFDFLHLEERLKEEYKRGIVLRRIVKILSGCIIIAIFIDYWAKWQFTG